MLVRDFMRTRQEILVVRLGVKCADMIGLLTAEAASCAVVVDAAGLPVGIITERDIARRIAFRVAPETPVEEVMTSPVTTIRRDEYLYHAIAEMRRMRLRHLPVVDHSGRLCGMIYLHDALTAAAERLIRQIERLSHEGTLDGLKEVKAAQVELAEELFEDDLPAVEIQHILTRINNDMYRRIGDSSLRSMDEEGWGDFPVEAATIVMGSGGRGENYLFPDQDNGFVITDYPDHEHGRIDRFFLELAERMCRDLNAIGIPYCNGYCMAVNPLWRKTLPQWIEQIRLWGKKSNFVAIRLSDIFFDFQPVWGKIELAQELRSAVTELVSNNHYFLRQMFQETAEHNVALGLFGGLVTEREKKEYKGQVNLKYTGTIPLVESIRLLALRDGVEETGTLDRIRALNDRGTLTNSEKEDLSAAFHLITEILLRQQVADFKGGRRVGYYVNPDNLAKQRRTLLIDSLKAIEQTRKRVHMEFTGNIF
jgi:signal-transduction protein with cAMP-binding, CBS, and nucleotidyltransferase domain